MSRRDTIIIAVLVNAGLLIVLFSSALKSNSESKELATTPSPVIIQESPEPLIKKETTLVAGDEVDQALNQFSQGPVASIAPPQTPAQQPSFSPPTPVAASASSFADDLNAIAAPGALAAASEQTPMPQILTAPIAPQIKPVSEFIEVKVKKGDVLEKIARHHHTTVAEIMKANKLTSSNLRIGQVLKIPNKTIKKAETSTISHTQPTSFHAETPASNSSSKFYTVKKGDSPWTIAVKNHLKVEDLLKLNNMNEEQARRLKPGDQIRIN
jgi:LysM repeat protein